MSIEVGPQHGPPVNILVLPVNPGRQINKNFRVTAIQTIDSVFTDDYGVGLQSLSLTGTTAFQSAQGNFNGSYVDGNTALLHLEQDIINYYFSQETAGPTPQGMKMEIYDNAFGKSWQVKPMGNLQISRTPQSPMTANYSIQFLVLSDLIGGFNVDVSVISDPVKKAVSNPQNTQSTAKKATKSVKSSTKAASQAKPFIYTVASGDNLWDISKRFLPTYASNAAIESEVKAIASLNHIANANLIFPGQRLTIPH